MRKVTDATKLIVWRKLIVFNISMEKRISWLRSRFHGHRGRDVQLWVFAIIFVVLKRAVVREMSNITFCGLLWTA